MLFRKTIFIGILLLSVCIGCERMTALSQKKDSIRSEDPVSRLDADHIFSIPQLEKKTPIAYPWEKQLVGGYPRIKKDHFRCRGSFLHPILTVSSGQEPRKLFDCGGRRSHSLPVRNKSEFIYPVLIDLLNYIQESTRQRVVITCGHRCPSHNTYADSSSSNTTSKHLIGAEVDFYVEGKEDNPQEIIHLIMNYYQQHPDYQNKKEFKEFTRYTMPSGVSTQPWYNKEVFIKLHKPQEGRDLDNQHPYPYITLQVRYDRELNQKVECDWKKIYQGYFKW